jgi:hypothetical protein
VSWRPSPHASSATPLQGAVLNFGAFLVAARRDLDEREYETLLSIVAARIAREYRLRLDERVA